MRIEYQRNNWIRQTSKKKMPELIHFVPYLLLLPALYLIYKSLQIAYETVGNVAFSAVYCAVGAFVVSLIGLCSAMVSAKRRSEKKWISWISLVLHGLILLFVFILYGMGL